MSESLALAAVSRLVGLGITIPLLRVLPRIVPSDWAIYTTVALSLPVLLFALVLSVATPVFFGFVPAWQLSFVEPQSALKGSRTQAGQKSHSHMRSAQTASRNIFVEHAAKPLLRRDTDVIIAASTASGKTEAAFLPIASSLVAARESPGLVVYVSPLKALINDQYQRLGPLFEHLDLPAVPWHGDVSKNVFPAP